jgi:septal ring factor EnvC (AmiA/AmiB activator)
MGDSPEVLRRHAATPAEGPYAYTPRWVLIAFLVVLGLIGGLVYALVQQKKRGIEAADIAEKRSTALGAELDRTNAAIADLKTQLQVTQQKLSLTEDELASARSMALTVRKDQRKQEAANSALRQQIGQVQQQETTQFGAVSDALNGTKSDVASERKDLDDARGKLTTAIGDLGVQSGLIARNHEEVEELKRLNERNIYEFKLTREKLPQRVGPIQLQLRKINAKLQMFTINIIADDRSVQRKDKTVEEPIQFYTRGTRILEEIVVYEVTKNSISGYLSTPKTAPVTVVPANR